MNEKMDQKTTKKVAAEKDKMIKNTDKNKGMRNSFILLFGVPEIWVKQVLQAPQQSYMTSKRVKYFWQRVEMAKLVNIVGDFNYFQQVEI